MRTLREDSECALKVLHHPPIWEQGVAVSNTVAPTNYFKRLWVFPENSVRAFRLIVSSSGSKSKVSTSTLKSLEYLLSQRQAALDRESKDCWTPWFGELGPSVIMVRGRSYDVQGFRWLTVRNLLADMVTERVEAVIFDVIPMIEQSVEAYKQADRSATFDSCEDALLRFGEQAFDDLNFTDRFVTERLERRSARLRDAHQPLDCRHSKAQIRRQIHKRFATLRRVHRRSFVEEHQAELTVSLAALGVVLAFLALKFR